MLWRGPRGKGRQAASRSSAQPVVSTQQANRDLSPKAERNWVLPTT